MTVLEALKEAKSLLVKPWGWKKYRYRGEQRGVDCFCAAGALQRVTGYDGYQIGMTEIGLYDRAYKRLAGVVKEVSFKHSSVESYNDEGGVKKQDIIALFDKAIAAEEKEETSALAVAN